MECIKAKTLSDYTQDIDTELGSMKGEIDTLLDVDQEFGQLLMDLNNATNKDELAYFIILNTSKIRVLGELMHYLAKDLNHTFEKTYDIHQSMFDKILKEESQPVLAG